jgi:DNA-binding SARP family transcriptional activator
VERQVLGEWAQALPQGGPLRLRLLGGFALARDGEPVTLPISAQRLLALLALRGHRLRRAHVAGTLWPEATQTRSCANLRSALWRLHCSGLDLVTRTVTHVELATSVWVDTHDVVALARRLLDGAAACSHEDLDSTRFGGELLPDWDDDWLLVERERLRQLCLHSLEAQCRRLVAIGRYGAAVEAGLAAVAGEPLRESAHRALITVYLAEGNHSEALRQYQGYRGLLREELGLDPSRQMAELLEACLEPAATTAR